MLRIRSRFNISYLLSVGSPSIRSHVEDDVLERCSLRNLPVNTSTGSYRHRSSVKNEVPDLAIEVVLVSVPVSSRVFSDQVQE
jgi:hypothetical protein